MTLCHQNNFYKKEGVIMFFKYDEVSKLTDSEVRDSLVNALTLIDSLMESLTEKNLMVNELSEMVGNYKNQCIELQESNDSLHLTVDYLKQKNNDLEDIVIRDNEISDYYNNLISDMENEITDLNNQIIEEQNRYDNLDNAYEVIYNKLSYYQNEYETIIVPDKIKALNEKYDNMVETAKSIIDKKNNEVSWYKMVLNKYKVRLNEWKKAYHIQTEKIKSLENKIDFLNTVIEDLSNNE